MIIPHAISQLCFFGNIDDNSSKVHKKDALQFGTTVKHFYLRWLKFGKFATTKKQKCESKFLANACVISNVRIKEQ